MSTRAELRTDASNEIFRNTHSVFEADVLNQWADEAMQWLVTQHPEFWHWETIDTTTFATLGPGPVTITMPTDFNIMRAMWNATAGFEVELIDLIDLKIRYGSDLGDGAVRWIYPAGVNASNVPKFTLAPDPAASTALEVIYYRKPNLMTSDGDQPDLPSQFHPFVKNFMVNRAAMFLEDIELQRASWIAMSTVVKEIGRLHQRRVKRKHHMVLQRLSTIRRKSRYRRRDTT